MLERCSCLRCLSNRKEQTSHGPMEWFLLPDFTTRTKWIGWNYLSAILHAGKARTLKLKISPVLGRFRLDLESEFGKGFRHRVLKIIIKLNKLSLQFRTCKINCQNWGFYFIDLKKEEHNAEEQYYTEKIVQVACFFFSRRHPMRKIKPSYSINIYRHAARTRQGTSIILILCVCSFLEHSLDPSMKSTCAEPHMSL